MAELHHTVGYKSRRRRLYLGAAAVHALYLKAGNYVSVGCEQSIISKPGERRMLVLCMYSPSTYAQVSIQDRKYHTLRHHQVTIWVQAGTGKPGKCRTTCYL